MTTGYVVRLCTNGVTMNTDAHNNEAQMVATDGKVMSEGSLAAIVRMYEALPSNEKQQRSVRYGGQSYSGDAALKLLAQHQQA
jgi:hypothetical protein